MWFFKRKPKSKSPEQRAYERAMTLMTDQNTLSEAGKHGYPATSRDFV